MLESRLYAILDADACRARGLDLLAVGEALCDAAPAMLQLRAKGRSATEVLAVLARLRSWTKDSGTLLYLNDRADLAELAGCDGVHVGQGDQAIAAVRHHFPRLRVGLSTHSEAEFDRALLDRPDYLALGPIFGTKSKQASEPVVGLLELERLAPRARAMQVPLVAIGGIDHVRAGAVLSHADYVATIAALMPEQSPGEGEEAVSRAVLERARAFAQSLGAGGRSAMKGSQLEQKRFEHQGR